MNAALEELIEQLIDTHINSWYTTEISNDQTFVSEIRYVTLSVNIHNTVSVIKFVISAQSYYIEHYASICHRWYSHVQYPSPLHISTCIREYDHSSFHHRRKSSNNVYSTRCDLYHCIVLSIRERMNSLIYVDSPIISSHIYSTNDNSPAGPKMDIYAIEWRPYGRVKHHVISYANSSYSRF